MIGRKRIFPLKTDNYSLKFILNPSMKDVGLYLASTIKEEEEIIVPEQIEGFPVASVWMECFGINFSCKHLILPKSITMLSDNAFRGASIEKLTIMSDAITLSSRKLPKGLKELDISACSSVRVIAGLSKKKGLQFPKEWNDIEVIQKSFETDIFLTDVKY